MADLGEIPDDFATMFVTGLVNDEAAVKDFFSAVGTVINLRFLLEKEGQLTRGGVITMSSGAEARDVMSKFASQTMDGADRRLSFKWDERALERHRGGRGGAGGFGSSGGRGFGGSGFGQSSGGAAPEVPADLASIWVMGLPVDDDVVDMYFSEAGTVVGKRFLPMIEGKNTRVGSITMSSHAEAQKAMDIFKGRDLSETGRSMKIEWDLKSRMAGGGGNCFKCNQSGHQARNCTAESGSAGGGFGKFTAGGFGGASSGSFGGTAPGGGFSGFGASRSTSVIVSPSVDGETIFVNGRELTALRSNVNGESTVIGYIFKDSPSSVPGTPAVSVNIDRPVNGSVAKDAEPAKEAPDVRRSFVREEPIPRVEPTKESTINVPCRSDAPPVTQTSTKELGDIMPRAFTRTSSQNSVPSTLGGGATRSGYFARRTTLDVGAARKEVNFEDGKVLTSLVTDQVVPAQQPAPVVVPVQQRAVPAVSIPEASKPQHARITPPTEGEASGRLAALAKLRVKKPAAATAALTPLAQFIDGVLWDAKSSAATAVDAEIVVGIRDVLPDGRVSVWNTDLGGGFPAAGAVVQLSEELKSFYDADKRHSNLGTLTLYQPVAVSLKSAWYRAKWLARTTDGCSSVFRVDLGDEIIVPDSDLRLLDSRFGKAPALAVVVSIHGVPLSPAPIAIEDLRSVLQGPGLQTVTAFVKALSPATLVEFAIAEHFLTVPLLLKQKALERSGVQGKLANFLGADAGARVWVVDLGQKAKDLEALQEAVRIDASASRAPEFAEGAFNIVPFEDVYYRGVVVEIHDGECEVELIDYGNTFKCPNSAMRGLSTQLQEAPPPTDFFQLVGVPKVTYENEDFLADVNQNMNRNCIYETIAGTTEIRMWNDAGELVGEKWMSQVETAPVYPFMFDDLKEIRSFKEGDTLDVYTAYITDPELVYLAPGHEEVENVILDQLCAQLDAACPDAPKLTVMPPVGAIVCGNYLGNWYRAVVATRDSDTEAHIVYVDYGNDETVTLAEVREMTAEWMKPPKMLIQAGIYGIQPVDKLYTTEQKQAAEALLVGKPATFKVLVLDGCVPSGEMTLLDCKQSVADLYVREKIAVKIP
ncbi:hypothetical protein BV898_05006 [Hypsibius exemplaris]|uniref:Tudor domain-containing protein 1 n=1 Tax=Hypsibius exemplaris TaxID=2072580 RepID=A0A1W0X0D9_HYPEX|nr:hypothetical protein BV898_05006 [Hypsibius exemplaris]